MPGTDWLPRADENLYAFTANYEQTIVADPTAFGLDAATAAKYSSARATFVSTLRTAQAPGTNSTSNIAAKNSAKKALMDLTRSTARTVRNHPAITNEQLAELGLTVPDPTPTRAARPGSKPGIQILETSGNDIRIRLRDADNPDSRAKPEGAIGAVILSAIGDRPPSTGDVEAWTWMGNTTRTLITLEFGRALPGATIWLTAMWLNTRLETGPATDPVVVQLPGTYRMAA